MDWTLVNFFGVTSILLAGSLVQAVTGMGGGFIIVPLLALISYSLVPVPIIFASLFLSSIMLLQGRAHIDGDGMGKIIVGLLCGTAIAAALVARLPLELMGILFASMILLLVGLSIISPKIKLSHKAYFGLGTLSAFMGATVGIGGPVLAFIYQRRHGQQIRANLALLYFVGAVIILIGLASVGKVSMVNLLDGCYLIPGYCAGLLLAPKLVHIIDKGYARWCVLAISSISAIVLLIKSV
jgi:uncharacterized protein